MWFVGCISVLICGVLCHPTAPNIREALQLEKLAVNREREDAQLDVFQYLLNPSNNARVFFGSGGGLFRPRNEPGPRDLELFDSMKRGEIQVLKLFDLFKSNKKQKDNTVKSVLTLDMFRHIRPLFGLLPPLRLFQEAKQQFHYYAGASEAVLDSESLRNSMNKLGMGEDAHHADDLIRGIMGNTADLKQPHLDRCDFVLAILKERDMITSTQIENADALFDRIVKEVGESNEDEPPEIKIEQWLDYPLAQSIFRFPSELNTENSKAEDVASKTSRSVVAQALGILFGLVDDGPQLGEEVPEINRCEHRILYTFSAPEVGLDKDGNIDRDLEADESEWTYETNGGAAWALERFPKRDMLGVTCRSIGKHTIDQALKRCTKFYAMNSLDRASSECEARRLNSELSLCNLPDVISSLSNPKEYKTVDGGKAVKFNPLTQGLDSLFLVNDDDGDLTLSSTEFSDLITTITLFGEMAYASTPPKTTLIRTVHNLPYFHQWYIAKGPKYAVDLFTRIALLGKNFRQAVAFKKFWKALHFPQVERIWESFKSDPEGPLQIFDVQGMYNRLGLQGGVAKGVLREWHRPLLYCDMKDVRVDDRVIIASLLLSNTNNAALESPTKLMDQFCDEVLAKGSTCAKSGNGPYTCTEPSSSKSTTDRRASLNSTEGEFESVGDAILTSIDLLDSVTFGIPAFNPRVAPDQFKYLFSMLHGSNDNFDEVTPERWQIIAPILRTFAALDRDSSGFLSASEFHPFGRCTSFAMPRFRLTSEMPHNVLFAKIRATSQILKRGDILFKGKDAPPADHIDLTDFAMLFSDLNSESCVRKYCAQVGDFETLFPTCRLMSVWGDHTGVEVFCRLNTPAKPNELCAPYATTTPDQKNIIKAKAEAMSTASCVPAGAISFESFFDPQFSSETKASLSADRIDACQVEISCQGYLEQASTSFSRRNLPAACRQ